MPFHDAGSDDIDIVESHMAFCTLFADYIVSCKHVQNVEFSVAAEGDLEDAERRASTLRRDFRTALRELGTLPANSLSGVLAKGRTIQSYFLEYPPEDEIMLVVESMLKDLENLC